MGILSAIKDQFRTVIQWEDPQEWELFRRLEGNDEIKNASKLIIQPGQGCIFIYRGEIKEVFIEPGVYDLDTDNKPFITALRKWKLFFESDDKTGLWFFRTAEIANMRWGTRMPITYNDPVYGFPVHLRAYGNYSLEIINAADFFVRIIASTSSYYAYDLQELILSRISQPIGHYLANARFSYAEIASHLEDIARDAATKTREDFRSLGFDLLDFRIEGTSFDEETNKRIAGISNIQADVKAAQLAGVSFESLQQMIAMRDAAKNENGLGAGMLTTYHLNNATSFSGNNTTASSSGTTPASNTGEPSSEGSGIKARLKELKELLDEGLIDEEEFKQKKQELLKML